MYQEKPPEFTSAPLTSNPELDPDYVNYWIISCFIIGSGNSGFL